MRRTSALILTVALAACSDPAGTVDYPITASAVNVWSGGSVDLHSRSFAGADSIPDIRAGSATLTVSRVDTFVVRVQLPPQPTGPLTLTFHVSDGRDLPAASLSAFGYNRTFAGANISGNPVRIPGTTQMLANGDTTLVRFDARTGFAVPALPGAAYRPTCTPTPGVSNSDTVALVSRPISAAPGSACRFYAVRSNNPLMILDSIPVGFAWSAAYLGSGRWILNTKSQTYGFNGFGSQTLIDQLDQPEEYVVSPSGARVFPVLGYSAAGVPVYDGAGLSIAYRLTRLGYVNGVAFSPGGDTAFVAGLSVSFDSLLIFALNPMTGQVFREGVLPGGSFPKLMAIDPDRPWLYLTDAGSSGTFTAPKIHVVDRRTLQPVALLRGPGLPSLDDGFLYLPVVSQGERKLYMVNPHSWNQTGIASQVFEFDLLP